MNKRKEESGGKFISSVETIIRFYNIIVELIHLLGHIKEVECQRKPRLANPRRLYVILCLKGFINKHKVQGT